MEIGLVIRKYRKEKHLTQEEMANRLGVTAPAVNKWENGNACPDIELLAPIARLLDITLDELLSFRESLTQEEINNYVQELDTRLKNGTYEEAFRWAKEKMEIYPNCGQLILSLAVVLDAQRMIQKISDDALYEEYIGKCYARGLVSEEESVRTRAADALFNFYCRREEYERAESYLTYFSTENPERKRKQAHIYSLTHRLPEAYKAYEEMLFSGYQMLSMVFHSLYMLAMKEDDRDKAREMVKKQQELARLFEMGRYNEAAGGLELAVAEQDKEAVIEIVQDLLAGIEDIAGYRNSTLYTHMNFKEPRKEFLTELKQNFLKSFRDEEAFGFLEEDPRWQELIKQETATAVY